MEAIWLGRGVPDLSDALRVARLKLGWDAYSKEHPLTLDLEIWGCETRTVFSKYRRVWELADADDGSEESKVLRIVQREPLATTSEEDSTQILESTESEERL